MIAERVTKCRYCEDGKVPLVRDCQSSTATEPFLFTGLFVTCDACHGEGFAVIDGDIEEEAADEVS